MNEFLTVPQINWAFTTISILTCFDPASEVGLTVLHPLSLPCHAFVADFLSRGGSPGGQMGSSVYSPFYESKRI